MNEQNLKEKKTVNIPNIFVGTRLLYIKMLNNTKARKTFKIIYINHNLKQKFCFVNGFF